MFRFKFNVTILVPSHCVAGKCWWIFGEIISVCAAQKCIDIPEMSVFWTIGSPQVRILTVTNLMPPSHFHIWRARKTKTPSNCLHTDPHTSSTLLRCWLTCASCDLSQPMRGQYRGCWPIRSQQCGLSSIECEGQLPWETSEFWVKQNILGKMILYWGGETWERQWDAW